MTTSPLGPPLLGALLRAPVDVIRARTLDALHGNAFTDLIPAHLVVLRYPGPDGRRPGEIAGQSGLSKQAANYHLGQLESLGYLERRDDPHDQRSKRVHLTPRGHAAMATIRAAVSAVEREWAQQLGAEDIELLRTLLTRLVAILGPWDRQAQNLSGRRRCRARTPDPPDERARPAPGSAASVLSSTSR